MGEWRCVMSQKTSGKRNTKKEKKAGKTSNLAPRPVRGGEAVAVKGGRLKW